MSELRTSYLTLPTAPIGPANPLPPLFGGGDVHAVEDLGSADEEMRHNIGYGRVPTTLPYLEQDDYARDRKPRQHFAVELDNGILRATFLPGTGGRLWSLVHTPSGRELLFRNPVYQPANLALRNAWVAGGVEWNVGTIGHSPLTCEPLHTAVARRPDGTPVLRMWEFERLRQVIVQIDAYLPDGSPHLFVHVRIINPNDHEVPMYWWSNIAVPERPDVRILAPASAAWQFSYDRRVTRVPMPAAGDLDRSYPARAPVAADYFFDLDQASRHWIAALGDDGTGLAQTSTRPLRGRKLFVWGQGPGGRHWQDWLSVRGAAYCEIQAGLARTQLEHLPMPANEQWSWLESYGLLSADPVRTHGPSWDRAVAEVEAGLENSIPAAVLDRELAEATRWADSPPEQLLATGSGWGALERRLRASGNDHSLDLVATPFPDASLGPAQLPWRELLETGDFIDTDPARPPESYQLHPQWARLLKSAEGWLPSLQLGVLLAANGDLAGAEDAWRSSVTAKPTAWALRNLAGLAAWRGQTGTAVGLYAQAYALCPDLEPLAREYVRVLLDAGQPADALTVLADCAHRRVHSGRLRLLRAQAELAAGRLDECRALLDAGIEVADVREGETSLDQLWFCYQAARLRGTGIDLSDEELRERIDMTAPLPRRYDFRMFDGTG